MRRNFQLTEEQENLMRPSKVLGYDRDNIGIACLEREMYEVALSQFKRAIYLNPYEVRFKKHLAWCPLVINTFFTYFTIINTPL